MDVNGREYLKSNFVDVVDSALIGTYFIDIQDNYGDNCNPVKCKSTVENLNVGSNDIVIFYYIGHGGRSIVENDIEHPWPKMWLGQDDETKMIDLGWVHDKLKAKNPRLLLTIGMCCNVKQNLPTLSEQEKACIKNAFVNTCGDLIATSSSPGQSSGGGKFVPPLTEKPMDYYTAAFVDLFNEMIENQEIDLVTLFNRTGAFIHNATKNKQTPIFKEKLKTNECNSSIPPTPPVPTPTPNCSELSENRISAGCYKH